MSIYARRRPALMRGLGDSREVGGRVTRSPAGFYSDQKSPHEALRSGPQKPFPTRRRPSKLFASDPRFDAVTSRPTREHACRNSSAHTTRRRLSRHLSLVYFRFFFWRMHRQRAEDDGGKKQPIGGGG